MANSTQGKKLSVAVQTAFNTPNTTSMVDVHLEGNPSVETPVGTGVKPDTMGANPFYNNKDIVNNQASDSAVVCTSLIRQPRTAGNDSFAKMAFEAGGYSVDSISTDTTVGASPTLGVIPAVSSTGMVAGMGVNLSLEDGSYMPILIGSMSTNDIIPTMEIPSVTDQTNDINKALTITPNVMTQVPNDKLLTMVYGTNVGTVQAQDCALTSIGDLVFNANEKQMLEYTFGASDKTRGDVATTHGNTFADGDEALVTYQPWCQIADSSTNYGTALTANYNKLISATITLGITAEQIAGFGDANCKNNIQGWMQKGVPVKIALDMLYDSDKLDDFDGTNDDKYLAIIQPGQSGDDPSIGFFAPVAHQDVAPTVDFIGNNEVRVQVTYTVNPSAMAGTTDADLGNQPWYLVIGDQS